MTKLYFKSGFKYQLTRTFTFDLPEEMSALMIEDIDSEFFYILKHGRCVCGIAGFAFDGASGPIIDDETIMKPACGHDIFYRALRLFPKAFHDADKFRKLADKWIKNEVKKEMKKSKNRFKRFFSVFRAWYILRGLKRFGKSSADPKNKMKEICID